MRNCDYAKILLYDQLDFWSLTMKLTLVFAIISLASGMNGQTIPLPYGPYGRTIPPSRIVRTLRTIPVLPSDQLSVQNPIINQVSGLITFDQWMVNIQGYKPKNHNSNLYFFTDQKNYHGHNFKTEGP